MFKINIKSKDADEPKKEIKAKVEKLEKKPAPVKAEKKSENNLIVLQLMGSAPIKNKIKWRLKGLFK